MEWWHPRLERSFPPQVTRPRNRHARAVSWVTPDSSNLTISINHPGKNERMDAADISGPLPTTLPLITWILCFVEAETRS